MMTGTLADRALIALDRRFSPVPLVPVPAGSALRPIQGNAGLPVIGHTIALFGEDSDPALCAPRGPATHVLRHIPLAGLPVTAVQEALAKLPARG